MGAFDYMALSDPDRMAALRRQATAEIAGSVLGRSEPMSGLEAGAVRARLDHYGSLVDGVTAAAARRAVEAADPAAQARRDDRGRFIADASARAAAINDAAARAQSESWAEGRLASADLAELNRAATPRPGFGYTGS